MIINFTAEQLATEFVDELRDQLTPAEFAEVRKRNAAETNPLICHSHDFCDANMVMLDAIERLGIPRKIIRTS
jgi:hypothetical protein